MDTHDLTHHGVLRLLVAALVATVLVVTLGVTPAAAEEPPTTTEELLSGMDTEEVEPGVFRVVNDGVRDLTSANNWDVVVAKDGGIWLLRRNRFFPLGDDRTHKWPENREFRSRRTRSMSLPMAPFGPSSVPSETGPSGGLSVRTTARAGATIVLQASTFPDATTASPMPMPEVGDMNRAPVFFEGEVDWTGCCGGCMSVGNPSTSFCSDQFRGSMEASDPRLDGQVAAHTISTSGAVRIENERGVWTGAVGTAEDVAGMRDADRFGAWLVGEDAYEGLNAFMYATLVATEDEPRSQEWTIEGWVFGDVPWPEAVPEA